MKTSQSPSRIAAQIECTRKQLIAYKGDNIKLSSIDKKYCVGFIEFLNNTKKSNGEPLSSYTKIMYCNHLNEMLSRAVKGGMIYKNPFSEVDKREKPKKPETSRVFLDIEEVKKLAESLLKLNSSNSYTILVEGHTADVNKPEGQMKLSIERTQTIIDELVKNGLDRSIFSYRGYGGTQPVASNDTPEGRAQNRRVIITARPKATYIQRN